MKKCTKCLLEKPEEHFSKNSGKKAGKSGLKARCKICLAAEAKQWFTENAVSAKAKTSVWRIENAERIQRSRAEYYKAHSDEERAASTIWHAVNKELASEIGKSWRARNYAKVLGYVRSYRAKRRNAEGAHTVDEVQGLFKLQRGMCAVCRCKLTKYHVDHVIPLIKGGSDYINNLQILCRSCNSSKGAKNAVEFMQTRGYLL